MKLSYPAILYFTLYLQTVPVKNSAEISGFSCNVMVIVPEISEVCLACLDQLKDFKTL
jgi:hypothetical protein